MRHLLSTVAALALLTTTASAYEVNCGAPRIMPDDRDSNPVVSVDVRYEPDDHAWRVFHRLADGRVVSRSEQYAITDASTDNMAQWQGSHQKMRHLYMVGEVRRERDGIYYHEWQYNRNTNTMLFQSKALCRAAVMARSEPSRPSQPDIILERRPEPAYRQQAPAVMWFIVPTTVSSGYLNIRSGPGANHSLLGAIPAAERVSATTCAPRDDGIAGADWCLVTWRGITGWASRAGLMPL